ncbi:MAG: hypothetical protein NDI61_00090 [Bdellovibrionaceae bacterium]|nr:hypothetical protein [Pseudobdellovibrionaceae bacterium]
MKLRLVEVVGLTNVPSEACPNCMREFANQVSAGATLRVEEAKKAENRLQLWRNRVALIKQAKQLMVSKLFSDAAVSYEKYLRILEVVYERKPGELSPDLFSNGARKQELTVISSVYWDLMRIYDVNPRYRDRQLKAAEKLAEFSRFTPVLPNLIKKAEAQTRQAKNPDAYKHFLKLINAKRARCFIATAAFEGHSPEVMILCRFRDEVLRSTAIGRRLTLLYYRFSPPVADFLDAHPGFKPPTRKALTWLARTLSLWMGPRLVLRRKAFRQKSLDGSV